MPRTPLGPITPNIIRRREISPFTRGIIAEQHSTGASIGAIVKELNLSKATIQTTLSIVNRGSYDVLKPRSGRLKVTTDRDERIILRLARFDLKQTYQQLITAAGLSCSKSIVYRIFYNSGITNWIVKKRPLLRQQDVDARLKWARLYKDWTFEKWAKVIWSDECSVERGSGKRKEWCFRTPI